jgi:CheY-like chemotaxis protein
VRASKTVVVVEDTAEILELISVVLTDEGYRVVPCPDAVQALDTVVDEQPALIIADLRMAGVGRWELVDTLTADPRTGHVPILVCSGDAAELRRAEGRLRTLGGDVLIKPFDIEQLATKVRELIAAAESA